MRSGPILVVEDMPNVLELLEVTLRFKGYEVVSARNGLEGLEMVEEKARMELGMVRPNEIYVQIKPGK